MSPLLWSEVLEFISRTTVMAMTVAVVLHLTRTRSSAARHTAWTAVLLAMLIMPVAMRSAPPITLPWPALPAPLFDPPRVSAPPASGVSLVSASGVASTLPATVPASAPRVRTPSAPPARAARAQDWSWSSMLIALYAMGAFAMTARLVVGWRAARRLIVRSRPVDEHALVHESSDVSVPLTVGLLRPAILLPPRWRIWTADKLEAVLAHERAHIARHDVLILFLAHVNRAIFWFHPLAWWLERRLAAAAEDAADDLAAAHVGQRGRYAEVLVEIAAAAGCRVRPRAGWHGVGMAGASRLRQRVDRLLDGERVAPMSRVRRVLVAAGCATAVVLAIACQRQAPAPQPLAPDPDVTERLTTSQGANDLYKTVWGMSPEQVADLQVRWDKTPGDLKIAEQLLIYYEPVHNGTWMPDARSWIPARRRIALWLAEHAPESALNSRVRLGLDRALPDPEGHAALVRLWREAAARPDVKERTLRNAATFFARFDPTEAERLLLRGLSMYPNAEPWTENSAFYGGRWETAIGDLYASAIMGRTRGPQGLPTFNAAIANGSYAAYVRRTLDASTSAQILAATGRDLVFATFFSAVNRPASDTRTLGRSYLTRAITLAPSLTAARYALHAVQHYENAERLQALVDRGSGQERGYQARIAVVAGLSDAERLIHLPDIADDAYMVGEMHDHYVSHPTESGSPHTIDQARDAFDVSQRAATEALSLAARVPDSEDAKAAVYRANLALGISAVRAKDRVGALRHLAAAADAPSSDYLRFDGTSLEYRLTDALLAAGEYDAVATFYERTAPKRGDQQARIQAAAAAIRAGRMPEGYQRRLASRAVPATEPTQKSRS